jgi:hypothetical protein
MAVLLIGAVLLSALALPNLRWSAAEASTSPATTVTPRAADAADAATPSTDPPPSLPEAIAGLLPPDDTAVAPPPAGVRAGDPATPAAVQCGLQAVQDAATSVLVPLDELLGGLVPTEGTLGLLAQATGCTKNQVLVDVIVFLLDVGRGLPDPLKGTPAILPVLPLLPDQLVQVLAPAVGPLLAPMCEAYSTVVTVVNLLGDAYPWPIGGVDVANVLLYLSITCGSLS